MAQIIGTGIQRSGKNSAAIVTATVLAMAKWTLTFKGVDLDTMNFTSAGYQEGILGPIGLEWSLGGLWDAGTNPNADPPGLYPRDNLQDVQLVVNVADATAYEMTYARVRSAVTGTTVTTAVAFDASGMSQGPFTIPVGEVT